MSSLCLAAGLSAQIAADLAPQREFVQRYCFDCHGGDKTKGKLDLTVVLADSGSALWRVNRMRERALAGEMPPPGADQPAAAERAAFVQWVDARLVAEVPKLPPQPGRVTVRRLSRTQWHNTVHDLFGVEADTSAFPAEDLAYGFDTVGDALTFSTLHLEKYLAAAAAVADQVFDGEDPEHPTERRFEAEAMPMVAGSSVVFDGSLAVFLTYATIAQVLRLPRDGNYHLTIRAAADPAGKEAAKMRVALDDRELDTFEVEQRRMADFTVTLPITGGEHRLAITFLNDYYDPKNPDPNQRDRNLRVDWAAVTGPLEPRPIPVEQAWLRRAMAGGGGDLAELHAVVAAMLGRAWRRPPTPEQITRVHDVGAALLRDGEPLDAALRAVLQTALVSPHFLFRIEDGDAAHSQVVPPIELATRLAYFLWGSCPDATLLELAENGRLASREVLDEQVDRLLADARADSLATDFAAQWFELGNLWIRTPDPARFPGFDDALRSSLRRETELVFREVLRKQLDVRDLLDCDFTFLDARLAAFYGIALPGPGDGFQRVALPAKQRERGGILGHGSVLAITSSPTRTSPVKRGRWILDNLLGQPPPPPTPGNDSFKNEQSIDSAKTLREQLAQHRERSECAICHVRMDTLGFALERFDAIGRRRTQDAGGPIDASGELPGGRRIDGITDLKALLRGDPAFVRLAAKKLFVYGIGREPGPVDRLELDYAVNVLLQRGKVTLVDLVKTIVHSDAFLLRGGENTK